MTAQHILEAIGPELRTQILTFIQTDVRPAYRAMVFSLAAPLMAVVTFAGITAVS